MTFEELSGELDRLHGLPFPPADYQTHWEGLRDMPHAVLSSAVKAAARVCERFPAPAELRSLADSHRPSTALVERPTTALAEPVTFTPPFLSKPITIEREWHYYCEDCSDTGQVSVWCMRHPGSTVTRKPWMLEEFCTLKSCNEKVLYPHEWVRQCSCWYTNPALRAKRDSQAKYAEQRTDRRR